MKYAKVMTIKTCENTKGQHTELVLTINDKATPEMIFEHYGLTGSVESYTITKSCRCRWLSSIPISFRRSSTLSERNN